MSLPWPPSNLSPNARVHHMALYRARKAYKALCFRHAKFQGLGRVDASGLSLDITFHPPRAGRIDPDNCLARFKAALDALSTLTGVDDSKFCITFRVGQPVQGGRVDVTVSPI